MTVIENITEIEYVIHEGEMTKDDKPFVRLKTMDKKEIYGYVDVDDVYVKPGLLSAGLRISPDFVIFTPLKPIACWVDPHTGDTMTCDSMAVAKREHWKEKDAKIFQNELDADMTGQDRERWDAEHGAD